MKRLCSILAATAVFAALIIYPTEASTAAQSGIDLCLRLIIPTLFPFFVTSVLLSELGFTELLGRLLSPIAARLFGVSGKGATAFVIGLCGGYPLGAAYIADMLKGGAIDSEEAAHLLPFCNNSGPAFIIGAVGVGIFSSSAVGLFLYGVHIFAAAVGGVILGGGSGVENSEVSIRSSDFASALTEAVRRSVTSILGVCGFVVAFSVFCELLYGFGSIDEIAAKLSSAFCLELHWGKALFIGLFELGSGIGAMAGLSLSAENLALAAFLLSWGGVSVHFQTLALLKDTEIKTARYMIGRFMIAVIAAIVSYLASYLFF